MVLWGYWFMILAAKWMVKGKKKKKKSKMSYNNHTRPHHHTIPHSTPAGFTCRHTYTRSLIQTRERTQVSTPQPEDGEHVPESKFRQPPDKQTKIFPFFVCFFVVNLPRMMAALALLWVAAWEALLLHVSSALLFSSMYT